MTYRKDLKPWGYPPQTLTSARALDRIIARAYARASNLFTLIS